MIDLKVGPNPIRIRYGLSQHIEHGAFEWLCVIIPMGHPMALLKGLQSSNCGLDDLGSL